MRKVATFVALCLGCSSVCISVAHGQGRGGGAWSTAGGDPQLTGWQKSEDRLTKSAAKNIKFLWKIKLGSEPVTQPTEPLFGGHTITNYGFKDMAVILGPRNTLTNVDYELGTILWQRRVESEATHAPASCANGRFSAAVIQPAPTFGGGGARGRGAAGARGAAPVPPPAPPAPVSPRVGAGLAGGVGFGGMRGIFVLTSDGNLHEQILTNGWDYGSPVKFLPADTSIGDTTIEGSTIYVNSVGCGGSSSNGVYAIDMASEEYQKASYSTGSIGVTGTDGPAMSTDGKTIFVTTGSGSGSGDAHPNSVVALDGKTMQVKNYFTPSGADSRVNINVSPVVFAYKGRDVIAAYVAGGRLALLDSTSLGGSDHHTPLAISTAISRDRGAGSWGRLASAEDANGIRFIYVSVRGPLAADSKFSSSNGAAPDGSIVAFKVQDQGGKTLLTPAWASPDVANPSPAAIVMNMPPEEAGGFGAAAPAETTPPPHVIATGLVFTLAEGEAATHAKLYALDAETGAPVYSSGEEIAASANDANISISGGHVLFVTSDNTLYAFGVAYERE